MKDLTKAAEDVLAERQRQMTGEGWSPEHDDGRTDGSLALAAAAYALQAADPDSPFIAAPGFISILEFIWPRSWSWHWWKPKDRRSNLVRAGALILAEIERLDRAAARRPIEGDTG